MSCSRRYNSSVMSRLLPIGSLALVLWTASFAQQATSDKPSDRNREAGESSSRDTQIDIAPPRDDAKAHPYSKGAVADMSADEANADKTEVQEFRPWNPMKALKDVEVGDYYFKRKNYRAALSRYKEALYYKDNDAMASFRLAQCQEKLGDKAEAQKYYQQYLKILPQGPFAKEAQSSLDRLARNEAK